jgi:hypothetical protein
MIERSRSPEASASVPPVLVPSVTRNHRHSLADAQARENSGRAISNRDAEVSKTSRFSLVVTYFHLITQTVTFCLALS